MKNATNGYILQYGERLDSIIARYAVSRDDVDLAIREFAEWLLHCDEQPIITPDTVDGIIKTFTDDTAGRINSDAYLLLREFCISIFMEEMLKFLASVLGLDNVEVNGWRLYVIGDVIRLEMHQSNQ